MITYTYKCKECEVVFETEQRITDDPYKDCPDCEAVDSLEKVISSAGGFRIGGLGVYKPTSRMDM